MTDGPIVTQLPLWSFLSSDAKTPEKQPDLHTLGQHPDQLPACVSASPTILRCLELLRPLDWAHLPERNVRRNWGRITIPYSALIAADSCASTKGYPRWGIFTAT